MCVSGFGRFKSNMCVLEFVFSFVLELVAFLRSFVSGTGVLRGVKLVHIAWIVSLVRMTARVL